MKKSLVVILLGVFISVSAFGGIFDVFKNRSSSKKTVGAVLLDTSGEWFAEVIAGMEQAGEDLGVDVKIVSTDSDVAREADLIDQFIAQQVDAISISPNNDRASVPAFERAVAANIPVVTWNSKVDSPESKYFVGVDNRSLGTQTGTYAKDYIASKMGGKATIGILSGDMYSVGIDRTQGFLDVMNTLPNVKVVAKQDAETKEKGLSVTESMLQANPDIDFIWAWNLTSLDGALAALKGKGETSITLMGTDMSIDLAKEMQNSGSVLKAVTTQQPYLIGYTSIKNAVELINEGTTDQEVLVPLRTYVNEQASELEEYVSERGYLN